MSSNMFNIEGKIAVVTGGASGIGLCLTEELLKNNLKGVTIADVDETLGQKALNEFQEKFGKDKVIFVNVDVTDKNQFKDVFETTIKAFGNVDIAVNCAGILKDGLWEREVDINVKGTVNGNLLALEHYLPKYKSGEEGVLVNMSSIAGIDSMSYAPIYSATKSAIIGLSRSFGSQVHYDRTKVRVITVCPGYTVTPMVYGLCEESLLSPIYHEIIHNETDVSTFQQPSNVSSAIVHVIKEANNGSVWVAENDEPPYEVSFATRFDRKISHHNA